MKPVQLAALVSGVEEDRRNGVAVGDRLCQACVELLEVAGAGIMLMTGREHRGTLGVSDAVISAIEELQFTTGEGPCIDAFVSTTPVFEPDLGQPLNDRWPAFAGPAAAAGAAAVFGFPLVTGDVNVGALDLYLSRPGDLDADQVSGAVALAEVIATTVISLQADAVPGTLAPELGAGTRHRAVVYQASGVVAVQLGVDVDSALLLIRAHAYSAERPVNDVALDIIQHRLRLDEDPER